MKRSLMILREFFFPSVCALCGCILLDINEIHTGLCRPCSSSIKPETGLCCNLCGKQLISEQGCCLSCRNGTEHSYKRLWTIFPYTGKYQKLLLAYKFKKKLDLVNLFVKNVCEIISTNPELEKAVIVPVPPRPGKIKETGWDQVEYLVKKLEKKGLPVCRCLKRKKSKVQKKLTLKERKENLQGRILPAGLIPKKALVIDDIITTGSTLEVCSNVLKENGSEEVYGLCLFYD